MCFYVHLFFNWCKILCLHLHCILFLMLFISNGQLKWNGKWLKNRKACSIVTVMQMRNPLTKCCSHLTHSWIHIYLCFNLQPFFGWCKLLEKDQKKCPESAFKFIFYSSAYAYTSYLLFSGKYNFFQDTSYCWRGMYVYNVEQIKKSMSMV